LVLSGILLFAFLQWPLETNMDLVPEQAMLLLPFRTAVFDGAESLRVGVVLDSHQPSPWVDALLRFLRRIPGIDVHVLPVASRGRAEWKRPAWLVDRLYTMSRARFDPFGDVTLDGKDCAARDCVDAIRAAGCGVIIWLAGCQDPDVELQSLARHGVFTVRFGDRNQAIPFWDEMAGSSVTSTATIFWHDCSLAQGRAVRKAETCTSRGLFITANAQQPLIGTIRMLASLCQEVQYGGPQFAERVRALVAEPLAGSDPPDCPSNFEAARFVAKKLMRSAYRRWVIRGKLVRWFVAMRDNRGESIIDPTRMNLTGFKEIPLPKGVEAMADPFLWEAGGRQYLLFEELAEGQSRGRLGCVEVFPNGSCSEMKIILERPYHLSYPCVVPYKGEMFLLPETSTANRVELYRFSSFPWKVELVSSPIDGVPLADTTPIFVDGRWYFFTTTIEPFMETLLFSATRLEGPWSLHPSNPASTSVKNCRSAGQLFWRKGRLFRPTQDCSVRYGYAITVNEITKLTPSEFEEHPVSYLPPSWKPQLLGTHTWNESSVFQVIDGSRYAP
jgi:hypothetical protein